MRNFVILHFLTMGERRYVTGIQQVPFRKFYKILALQIQVSTYSSFNAQ